VNGERSTSTPLGESVANLAGSKGPAFYFSAPDRNHSGDAERVASPSLAGRSITKEGGLGDLAGRPLDRNPCMVTPEQGLELHDCLNSGTILAQVNSGVKYRLVGNLYGSS